MTTSAATQHLMQPSRLHLWDSRSISGHLQTFWVITWPELLCSPYVSPISFESFLWIWAYLHACMYVICAHIWVYIHAHMYTMWLRNQKRPELQLEKQATIWAAMWELETKPRSSSRAASALNHWDIAQPQPEGICFSKSGNVIRALAWHTWGSGLTPQHQEEGMKEGAERKGKGPMLCGVFLWFYCLSAPGYFLVTRWMI